MGTNLALRIPQPWNEVDSPYISTNYDLSTPSRGFCSPSSTKMSKNFMKVDEVSYSSKVKLKKKDSRVNIIDLSLVNNSMFAPKVTTKQRQYKLKLLEKLKGLKLY